MRLSDLVAFRNELDTLSILPTHTNSRMAVDRLQYQIDASVVEFPEFSQRFQQHTVDIDRIFGEFESTLEELKQQVDATVTQVEKHWFQESYNLYTNDMIREKPEYILNRRQNLSPEIEQLFNARLQNYTDWRFPGLIVRPGLEKFINTMGANDPLYIVDHHRDLLEPAVNSFADAYQQRLRSYVINERDTDPILAGLPDNQFGLCLVYNFFNFRPIELIRRWLSEIHSKLRPGGVIIMTINDCDRAAGVTLAESYYCCYTPGRMVMTLAETMGFEIIYTWKDQGPITWIEMKRSGQLTSMRGGQTLANIISESVAESK